MKILVLPGDELGSRELRSGSALLTLRRELKLFANFRPAILYGTVKVGTSAMGDAVLAALP